MTKCVVRSLICALIGALSFACTVEPAPTTDPGPTAGSGGAAAGSPATGGSAPVAGMSGGGTPGQGGTGIVPVAGSGGSSVAGSGGSGVAGGAGAGPVDGMSAGCGKQTTDEPRKYVQHDMTVAVAPAYQAKYTNRKYYTYLPANYDASKKYPLIFYGAGCGATMSESQPAMSVFNDQAILVFLLQVESCYQAGSKGTADSPDIPYFDQALTEIENNYCVDTNRVFMSGYSSGAWLSITLSCSHGDKLRGIAVAAGGQQPEMPPMCKGPVAALFYVSSNDDGNPVDGPTGSGVARDRLLAANGCEQATTDWDPRWPSCKKYSGCDQNPVVWCDHMGGHSNGQAEKIASDGWWKFFTELP